jgi:hypothetical protein
VTKSDCKSCQHASFILNVPTSTVNIALTHLCPSLLLGLSAKRLLSA